MSFKAAVVALAAFAGVAFSAGAASAMPNGLPQASQIGGQAANVEQVRWVCNAFGRCVWRRPIRFGAVWGPRPAWRRPAWYGAYAWGGPGPVAGPAWGWGAGPAWGVGPAWGWRRSWWW